MNKQAAYFRIAFVAVILTYSLLLQAQELNDFQYKGGSLKTRDHVVGTEFQFNGYTNHWQDVYRTWYRYGGLFKISVDNVKKNILQSKVDIAQDMGVPGFTMCEGFITGLLSSPYTVLDRPDKEVLDETLEKGNVLVFVDPGTGVGKELVSKLPETDVFVKALKSHQYNAVNLKRAHACMLEQGDKKLFVVSSVDAPTREKIKGLIKQTKKIVEAYDMHKGWFGAYTMLNSVTCTPGHPIDFLGLGMNEGNDWFVFNGYLDFLSKNQIGKWIKSVNLSIVTDVGTSPIFGCKDYDGLQVQEMKTRESWVNYAHKKAGYVFRHVWDTLADPYHYDGYIAIEGNKEQIDNEDVPFILQSGQFRQLLDENTLASMMLFVPKGTPFSREVMWEAILKRREVGIFAKGKMTGPANFRNALEMLFLDREYPETYFGERVSMTATTSDYTLRVHLNNTLDKSVEGDLKLVLPNGLKIAGEQAHIVSLPAHSEKIINIQIQPSAVAMGHANAIAVHFYNKKTLALLDLPPAISVNRLLYGHTPKVEYPVSVHNFTSKSSFPVSVKVLDIHSGKMVFKAKQTFNTPMAHYDSRIFNLELKPGGYKVLVSALGVDYESQLGVGPATGSPYLYPVDLNSDGVNEYRMENDSVQVTLLTTGARVIEYIVKSRNDNVLFKLWPKKAIDDKRPNRKWGYYPFGGFEDFLGQASMETHEVYDVEVIKDKGDFVRLKMTADYFGNKIEKTFTLYGNSPLLEVRFALVFKNPEANVLGPQPILHLGKKHWTEDVFSVPEMGGLKEYRMRPETAYGRLMNLKEGWNAGYDTRQDITYIGAFPVDQPLFLHMFMNHPRNHDSHYYYVEFQPWVPIYLKTTTYFTYYLWGVGGPWEHNVNILRSMNLISAR